VCGLAGFAGLARGARDADRDLRMMLTAIGHRGPDEFGYCLDDHAAVGLVRLAIIDLSLGKQPMALAGGRYWLTLNGTIVNYLELRAALEAAGARFQTGSDTEVLGQALLVWGTRALERLSGGFAFALHDRVRRRTMLGRDSIGERPLFYSLLDGGIAFASEIKGIFALPGVARKLSPAGLAQAFKVWSPIDPTTCFEGIHSLPPGHYGVFEDGRFSATPYFRLPPARRPPVPASLTFAEAKGQLRERIAHSVRIRLRTDFGAGVLVSGGIDSAAIAAAAAADQSEPVATFSFTLPTSALDESGAQLCLARHLRARHSSVAITPGLTRSLFPSAVYHAETPLFRPSAVAVGLLARHVYEQGYRVVLFGQGADELFCGYDVAKEAAFLARCGGFASDADRRHWLTGLFHDTLLTKTFSADALLREYGQPAAGQSGLGAHYRRFAREPGLADLARCEVDVPGHWLDLIRDSLLRLDPDLLGRPLVERSRAIDMLTMCTGWGMNGFADRVALPQGVEVRAPFLDPALIGFGWGLPEEFTLPGGRRDKHILREAFAGSLPAAVLRRPKQAMRALGAETLRPMGDGDWVGEVISRAVSGGSQIIDPAKARAVAGAVAAGGEPLRHPLNHAYCLMLSTLLLEDQFISNFQVTGSLPDSRPVVAVDERTEGGRS
jgi:asparagine synthase (glutamine-hydrolysing)